MTSPPQVEQRFSIRRKRLLNFVRHTLQGSIADTARYGRSSRSPAPYDATARVGFNGHGLRHQYAQDRYKEMTGRDCPKSGGPSYKDLTSAEKETDKLARQTIAIELGHGRIEITNVYLGR